MDLEQTAIERLRMASDMSLRLYKQPLVITYSMDGGMRFGETGEDVMHWWMEDGVLPGQMVLEGMEEDTL